MERATVSRIEGWDDRPVTGGYAGLADLAAAEFTGAVVAGGTHLFMLNGRVVGVYGGAISAFEGTESTAYEAPDHSLPLLFAMREQGGEVRGKYYTDDTPLREVDETLTDGGFTGFLELSENVLSGDYYVVYYGGRSLSAAFVGNEERVVTGEEAFELAADEVGIYEVRSVDLEVQDVPEPSEDSVAGAVGAEGAAATAGAAGAAGVGEAVDDVAASDEAADDEAVGGATIEEAEGPEAGPEDGRGEARADVDEPGVETETEVEAGGSGEEPDEGSDESADEEPAIADAETDTEPEDDDGPADESAGGDAATADVDAAVDSPNVEEAEAGTAASSRPPSDDPGAGADGDHTTRPPSEAPSGDSRSDESPDRAASAGPSRPTAAERRGESSEPDERFREEERWREARTVPALDPDETELPPAPDSKPPAQQTASGGANDHRATGEGVPDDSELEALRERVRELESQLEATERERRRQADRAEELEAERDELAEERAALQERIEELEARIEDQDERLEAQEAEIAAKASAPSSSGESPTAGAEAIGEEEALDQTDLFVRYRSKGQATLQTAHDGRADMEAVGENLRLETHSRFDPDGVAVDGRPFEEYLAETIEYRFVAWLVEELLYEIQGTGTERDLRALYDALPKIDRAEFDGTVTSVDEEGNERRETFDVVCRDRMGKPLVVANINDSLDPATGDMMGDLVEDATATAEAHDSIGAAFLVTASFFEPAALETASDATGGGFLSRDSKKSFVKLSRKGGYHLCLVEARGGDFHVAVPEL